MTVTIKDTDHERERHHLPWQSTKWAMSFSRRTLMEGFSALIRYQGASINGASSA